MQDVLLPIYAITPYLAFSRGGSAGASIRQAQDRRRWHLVRHDFTSARLMSGQSGISLIVSARKQ
ncbi:hypothetical protein OF83DRAFT_692354 [Amylostereum chailletii]|nr:hypothetical protein OF83DRAFT_692354 [Amylostereum chailletii]